MARWTYDVYLNCWVVSFVCLLIILPSLPFNCCNWLLYGTKPLEMIYSSIFPRCVIFSRYFKHILKSSFFPVESTFIIKILHYCYLSTANSYARVKRIKKVKKYTVSPTNWIIGHYCQCDPSASLEGQFMTWSKDNNMSYNPKKCKELIFRSKGNNSQYNPVFDISQSSSLVLLGVTIQSDCKLYLWFTRIWSFWTWS